MDCDTFDGVVEMFEQRMIEGCIANEFKCTYNEEKGEFVAEINGKFYVAMTREKR
jgi:hypothetical protein